MIQFRNDEAGYRTWLVRHPFGFVVNSRREPGPDYLVLHRAACGSISSENRRNYTTTNYIKTCSESVEELQRWAASLSGRLRGCSLCV